MLFDDYVSVIQQLYQSYSMIASMLFNEGVEVVQHQC